MREYFPRLIGNESTKSRIGRAIEEGRAAHAFLIGGPSGSGKNVLATEIAAAINCERRGEEGLPLPCGRCNTCKRIYEGNFVDVKILQKKKDKATLEVDLVKDFREDMFLSATESDYKVYIIDDAECMGVAGQNALLKVLEEPPVGVYIILLARECDRILTTIKSRTQYIAMSRFSDEETEKYILEKSEEAKSLYRNDRERFRAALISADGRLGLALKLASGKESSEIESGRKEVMRVIDAALQRGGFSQIHLAIDALPDKRTELISRLEEIICALRDLIVLKEDKEARLIFFTSRENALSSSGSADTKRLLALYDSFSEALDQCQKNANVGGLLTSLSARIKAVNS